jgi:hypothetical protein
VPLHTPYVDVIRQFGEERLAAVLARHSQVRAVLCGRPLLVAHYRAVL